MKDPLATYDRIPDATVESIAKGGRAYPHEARNMARELIKLRVQVKSAEPVFMNNPITWGKP